MKTLSPRIQAINAEIERGTMTSTELADTAKIAFSTLYRMLVGDTDPKLSTIEELERILKITYKRIER